jgi:NAD(P)-dependent dehydrogenase (short-subunit alcohol dehydrogenase family)
MAMTALHARAERNNISVDDMIQQRAAQLATGRFNAPDDVAALAVFLTSSDADNITGQAYNIDGGLVMVA